MSSLTALYKQRLNLQHATFSLIAHEDAMVAIVYKVTLPEGQSFILKVCERENDYLREVYFLNHFAERLPVPRIIKTVEPEKEIHGAILMEYIAGHLLKITEYTHELAYEIGASLAHIHNSRLPGYGDPILPRSLSHDPRVYFTLKFEEGLEECCHHLPQALLDKCRNYYDTHLHLLTHVDGPCSVHRDFRPGNLIIHENKLRGIIDWSGARASFAEEDFCSFEHELWPEHPHTKNAFLAGYASIRPVPNYYHLMPFLRLSKAIATIGFMVKRGVWESTHHRLYAFNRHFLETLV